MLKSLALTPLLHACLMPLVLAPLLRPCLVPLMLAPLLPRVLATFVALMVAPAIRMLVVGLGARREGENHGSSNKGGTDST